MGRIEGIARVLVEVALFVFALLQGAAAYFWILDRHRAIQKARLEGGVIPSRRVPVFATVLACGAVIAIVLGFWLVFNPPVQHASSSSQSASTEIQPVPTAKPLEPPAKQMRKDRRLLKPSVPAPAQPITPIPGGTVQTMTGSPGGIQAGGDVNIGATKPPPPVLVKSETTTFQPQDSPEILFQNDRSSPPIKSSPFPVEEVTIKLKGDFVHPAFNIRCNRPCTADLIGVFPQPGHTIAENSYPTKEPNDYIITLDEPRVFPANTLIGLRVYAVDRNRFQLLGVDTFAVP